MAGKKAELKGGTSTGATATVIGRSSTVDLAVEQDDFNDLIQGFIAERYEPVPEGKVRHVDIQFPQEPGGKVILTVTDRDPPTVEEKS